MVSSNSKANANTAQAGKGSKMQNLVDYRVRITLTDGRQLTGLLMAFDKYMNLVLADTEEFRRTKRRSTTKATGDDIETEEKRTLGLVILRGEQVVSLSVDAPPASEGQGRMAPIQAGFGTAKPVGRGLGAGPTSVAAPPAGLGGPTRGVGGGLPPAFGRGFTPVGGGPPSGPPPGMAPGAFRPLTSGFAPPGSH
jgi:small nuclear ribonucleoprotein B and B'